jgi:predicted dehydrogenase
MNEKIRVGVVGGKFCEVHIQGFQRWPEIEVVAICRRQKELAEQIAKKYGIPKTYTVFEEIVKRDDIDVISLAVPNNLHYPMTMKALEAGKHVICEKPLAMTINEAEEMIKKAKEKNRVHMTVFNWRFVPSIMRMKELVEDGEVGSIFHVYFSWLSNSRRERDSLFTWRYAQNEAGYGALGDCGVHGIDMIHWIVGEFKKVVSSMSIHVSHHRVVEGKYRKSEVEDTCSFLGEMVDGGQAIFQVSSVAACDPTIRFEIHGDKGALGVQLFARAGDFTGKLFGGKGEKDLRCEIPIPERLITDLGQKNENYSPRIFFFEKFVKHFIEGIQTGINPSPNFYDGMKAQRVLEALKKSSFEKRWAELS